LTYSCSVGKNVFVVGYAANIDLGRHLIILRDIDETATFLRNVYIGEMSVHTDTECMVQGVEFEQGLELVQGTFIQGANFIVGE
jgi:hypothetical protein